MRVGQRGVRIRRSDLNKFLEGASRVFRRHRRVRIASGLSRSRLPTWPPGARRSKQRRTDCRRERAVIRSRGTGRQAEPHA